MFASIPCPHGIRCIANPCPFKHHDIVSATHSGPPDPRSLSRLLGLPSVFSQHQLQSQYPQQPSSLPTASSTQSLIPTLQSDASNLTPGKTLLQTLLDKIQTQTLDASTLSASNDRSEYKRDYAEFNSNGGSSDVFMSATKRKKHEQLPHENGDQERNPSGHAPGPSQPGTTIGHNSATGSSGSEKVTSKSIEHETARVSNNTAVTVRLSSSVHSGDKGANGRLVGGSKKRADAPVNDIKTSLKTQSNMEPPAVKATASKKAPPSAKAKNILPAIAVSVKETMTTQYKSNRPKSASNSTTTKAAPLPNKKPQPSQAESSSKPKQPKPQPPRQRPSSNMANPQIVLSVNSKVSHKTRQNALNSIYAEFSRIYAPLLAAEPMLAHDQALAQETKLHNAATNKSYVGSAVSLISRLKQRPLAVEEEDVGLDGEWTARPASVALDADKLKKYCLQSVTLEALGYVMPPSPETTTPDVDQNAPRPCNRCALSFIPHPVTTKEDETACKYHWGTGYTEKANKGMQGRRIYSCCHEATGTPGCIVGPHVFKLDDYPTTSTFIPYKRLPPRDLKHRKERVMALDAEMSYTTAGMELTRLAIVNGANDLLLDEFVKTTYPVVDLNTRFSGVENHHIEAATFDLNDIHEWLFQHADQDTILIGHGLENDLIAMRLLHDKVVDTADLFKHSKGLPYRYSLKYLTTKLLGKSIQQGIESHNPVEDARSALELTRLRVEKGKNYVFTY